MFQDKVNIRKFSESDIDNKVRWINDIENNLYLHYDLPLEKNKTKEWFKNNQNRTDRYDAVIECNGVPVGIIGLLDITEEQAEYYVMLGEKKYKGKKIAKRATFLLLDYAFSVLNIRVVYLYTEVDNAQAQNLFERCGFRKIGIHKCSAVNRGSLVDRFVYKIFVRDFFNATQVNMDYMTPIYQIFDGLNKIYIKRDDLIPVSFGGNKARKAIKFFEDIDNGEYDCIVTYGSSSSNHCRVISNMAAMRNLPCYLIGPQEVSTPTYNSKMMDLFGAEITNVPTDQVYDTIEEKIQTLKLDGKKPYFIAGGGHGILGTQAYVECYEEIKNYEKEQGVFFDYIFFASGTGTTQAGLVCGKILHNDERNIVGISIARKESKGRQVVSDSIQEYFEKRGVLCGVKQIEDVIIFIDDYAVGYGEGNDKIYLTILNMMKRHGIPMDSTYTAKAYTGMMDYIEKQGISDKNVLFIHTGGTPLFFDDLMDIITI